MIDWIYGLFVLFLVIGTIRNVIKDGSGGTDDDIGGYGTFSGQ